MASIFNHNIASIAAAVKPGINVLVAKEIEHILDDAIKEIRSNLAKRIALAVETSVESVMNDSSTKVVVDCRVTIDEE